MRIHVMSDVHLSAAAMPMPAVDADVTVLAGDVCRPAETAMAWAAEAGRPVIYVAGNHEFYRGSIPDVRDHLAAVASAHGVVFLDQSQAIIHGVRFLGTTLWTDFELFGAGYKQDAQCEAAGIMRDYKVITNADGSPFTPEDSCVLFHEQRAWLATALAEPFDGPTVVVTHHAPSMGSIDPRYANSLSSAAFASDCDTLMGKTALWIHGHTHSSFDYVRHGTRVLCNPRGYCKDGVNENPQFDPTLCVTV